ncbi:hypothetical protein P4S63_03440 [Pseudoalteromonas sp. B193]
MKGSEVLFDLLTKITYSILALVVVSVTWIAFQFNPFIEALTISRIAWSTAYSAYGLKGETSNVKRTLGLVAMIAFYLLGVFTLLASR